MGDDMAELLGLVLGDVPAEIVDVRESHTQLAYRVAAIWG